MAINGLSSSETHKELDIKSRDGDVWQELPRAEPICVPGKYSQNSPTPEKFLIARGDTMVH